MRFFLHIGSGKTGTSVIQSVLARHRGALAAAGLYYPESNDASEARAVAGEVNHGNARAVQLYVFPRRRRAGWSEGEFDQWLDDLMKEADGRDVLLSSEGLQTIPPEALEDLAGKLASHGATPHVIFYMRHVLDVRVSSYAQFVKSGVVEHLAEEERSLDGFVATTRMRWHLQLRSIAAAIGRDHLHCRLYDADREDLVQRFVSIIDPSLTRALPANTAGELVNRTPNLAEFTLLEALNRLPQPEARRLCRIAMNTLLNKAPLVEAPRLHVSQEAFDQFCAAVQPMVDAVNAEFLPAETPLALTSGKIPLGTAPPPDPASIALLAAHCMAATAHARRGAETVRAKAHARPHPVSVP